MSDRELERLRAAFVADPSSAEADGQCPPAERIWSAVAGELAPDELGAVLDHVARHPACAEVWRLAREIRRAEAAAGAAAPRSGRRRWLAAAATLVAVISVPLLWRLGTLPPTDTGVRLRGPALQVESLVDESRPLPRNEVRLRWTPGPEGALYRVRVLTAEAELVVESPELERTEYAVPPAALAGQPAGARLLWQVEVLPGGDAGWVSPTFFVEIDEAAAGRPETEPPSGGEER